MSAPFFRALFAILLALSPALASAQGLRVVARVNDDAITDYDLAQRIQFALKTTGLQDTPDLRQRMASQVLRQMIDERGLDVDIEVDGGITVANVHEVCAAGANVIVSGSGVYGTKDYAATIAELRNKGTAARAA